MAFRLANKINRQLVQKAYRSLSAKRDAELEPIIQKVEESGKVAEASPPPPPSAIAAIPAQYEVCRPRTIPLNPFPRVIQNETDVAKKAVAIQHLQPAMLPEYYKPPIEINSSCMYFDSANEVEKQTSNKYRKFEESKTCKNVTLPLRVPKLANPFPDPVKVMQSHTISDQEKAEQMLADAKMTKSYTDNSKKTNQRSSVRSLPSNRHYSTNQHGKGKKCKIEDDSGRKKCAHFKVAGCAPIKTARCGKKKLPRPQCVKKEPPYPSYSETCHEDPYNKPSECKTCPYKPDEHPSFKPPKQSFHTFSFMGTKHKGECTKPPTQDKKPCGWVEEQKDKKQRQKQNKPDPKNKKKANPRFVNGLVETTALNAQKETNFLSAQARAAQEQKETEKTEARAKLSKTHQASAMSIGEQMGEWLERLQPADVLGNVDGAKLADQKSKCVKFPFKECNFPIVKERKQRPKQGKCPPKEKRKMVQDCPPDNTDECKRTAPLSVAQYLMTDDKEENRGKKRCPRVNLGVCHDPYANTDDPCRRKRKGKTLICPDDLLKKKPKPRKKTSPTVPFVRIKSMTKSDSSANL